MRKGKCLHCFAIAALICLTILEATYILTLRNFSRTDYWIVARDAFLQFDAADPY